MNILKSICKLLCPDGREARDRLSKCQIILSQTIRYLKESQKDYEDLLREAKAALKEKEKEEEKKIAKLETNIFRLERQLSIVPKSIIIPQAVQDWDNKYASANIYYTRLIPRTKKQGLVDVRQFLTPDDPRIKEWVKNAGVAIQDLWKCNDTIARIYSADRKGFSYEYDKQQFGVDELWLYPWETLTLGHGDCDDWANLLATRLLAAGLPPQRLRVVAGYTNGKIGGHCTVYVLGDDFKTWYHLNSTGYKTHRKLEDFPTSKDLDDKFGVSGKHIWFAYSKHKAWHEFRTTEARESYNDYEKKRWINIVGSSTKKKP